MIKKHNMLRYSILIGLLSAALLISGCQKHETQVGSVPAAAGASQKVIKDSLGRDVKVTANAEKVACLYAMTGHTIAMLGKGDKINAVVSGMKRDVLLTSMYPHILGAPTPSLNGVINIEELLKINPDVVLVGGETGRNTGEIAKLQKTNIPYLVIEYTNMKEQQQSIEMIGQVVGAQEKARKYNQYYQSCVERVQSGTKDIPVSSRTKIYHSVNESNRTDTAGTLPADWIQAAGAVNVSIVNGNTVSSDNKYFVGIEQIMLWDPDVIIVNEAGVDELIRSDKQWAALRAVQEKRVFLMPSGVSRWGHPGSLETPLALLWTAKLVYPDRFPDLDMEKEIKYFYKEFFNYPLLDEKVKQILSGKGLILKKDVK